MDLLPKPIKKIIQIKIIIVLLVLLIINPLGSSFAMTINSQEFFTYHLRDFLQGFIEEQSDQGEYALATGTYEGQIGGDFFGIAKGRNLIVLQLESIQNMLVQRDYNGQEIMPELRGLIESPGTIYFSNYYYQIGMGNTSDAEFASNNSIMGSMESYTYQLFADNYFNGLPWVLKKELGYQTNVFHGYKKEFWNRENIYPALGFDRFYSADDFESDHIKGIGGGNIVGISDHAFYDQATDYMTKLPEPYYSFLISLSCHNPFMLPEDLREIEIMPQHNNIVGNYINAAHYSDRCVGEFISELKEKGLYDNSIIVLYGDHFGLTKADSRIDEVVSDWLGEPYRYDTMMNVPLIIHIPGIQVNQAFENSGGQIDLMPTLCYLLGIEKLDTIYLGQNLFTGKDSTVAMQTHMLKGSYIKGDTVFEIARDGIYGNSKAWDRRTGGKVNIEGCYADHLKARQMIELSDFYLRNDILRLAIDQRKTLDEIIAQITGSEDRLPDKLIGRFVRVDDDAAIEGLFAELSKSNQSRVLLMSDDILELLTKLDKDYSGKSKVKGHASMDQSTNQAFLETKRKIIPMVSVVSDYTKVEYLGYNYIMITPDMREYPNKTFQEALKMNRPCGIVLPKSSWLASMNLWTGCQLPVYIYDGEIMTESKVMPVYRLPSQ